MSQQQQPMQLPKDGALLMLWFNVIPQPVSFLVEREAADACLQAYSAGDDVEFSSYPDGSGRRSQSIFAGDQLRGVTIEYATLQLIPGGAH